MFFYRSLYVLFAWCLMLGVLGVCEFLGGQVYYSRLYYAEFGWVVMRLTFLTKNKHSSM